MKSAIEKILAAHQLLGAFNSSEDYSVKIDNPPFMPLCIEKHGNLISVTHYFTQNGDLICDPDMEFEIIGGLWSPVAIQHSGGQYYRAVEYRDGKRFINPRIYHDENRFAKAWGRNLLAQGFAEGKVVLAEAG